eukprot:scpid80596/ scgid26742/ 
MSSLLHVALLLTAAGLVFLSGAPAASITGGTDEYVMVHMVLGDVEEADSVADGNLNHTFNAANSTETSSTGTVSPSTHRVLGVAGVPAPTISVSIDASEEDASTPVGQLSLIDSNCHKNGKGRMCHGTVVFYCNKKLRAIRRNKRCNLPCEDRQGNLYAHGESMPCRRIGSGRVCSSEELQSGQGLCLCARCNNAKPKYVERV